MSSEASPSELPPLSNGEASEANHHGLVVNVSMGAHNLWFDLAIALVIAVAAPLLLKKLLETEFAARLFRAPAPGAKTTAPPTIDGEFDFDA
jgi:hypothetical protein